MDEAPAWREWLLRAVAGKPSDLQIMYGLAGERRLTELELDWLPGYEGAGPGAHRQRRLEAVPARRLRRGDRRPVPVPPARPAAGEAGLAVGDGPAELPGVGLEGAGRGHLGGARPAAPLHALQGHGLGGLRPGGQGGRAVRPRRPGRPLAGRPRPPSTRRSAGRASAASGTPSCSPTAPKSWTPAC